MPNSIAYTQNLGIARRRLPSPVVDGQTDITSRSGSFGEAFVQSLIPTKHNLCDEGSAFVANNSQTGIATAAAPTAFSATNPFLILYNKSSSAAVNTRICLDYVQFLATASGTAGTSLQCAIVTDVGNRYTSGATILSPVCTNQDLSPSSVAFVYAGNLVATAATGAARTLVGNRWLKGAIPVVGDQYTLTSGGVDFPTFIGVSTITYTTQNVPAIEIGPNQSLLVYLWLPTQSAASSYAPEIAWYER